MRINFAGLSHLMGFTDCSNGMGNLMRKPMHFPCDEVYHRESNWKKHPYYGKSMSTNFPGSPCDGFCRILAGTKFPRLSLPVWWVWLSFPMLWEIDEKKPAFPVWWSIPEDENLLGKNHPYYGKSMNTNFPSSSHSMGSVAFLHTMEHWWGNICICHMKRLS